MENTILLYEELSMNAHPALRTQLYDGWVLRFSGGYTNRANSVNPLYPSTLPLPEKVGFCERIYAAQGLPPVFKLTEVSPAGLDAYLDACGYRVVTPSCVFTCEAMPGGEAGQGVTIAKRIEPSWREEYFRLNGTDAKQTATASAMMGNIQGNVLCAQMAVEGKTIACGLCVEERGYAGLYDIVVDPAYRRRGYGLVLCRSLLMEAAALGARAFYLQVAAGNAPAIALYQKLGFRHRYHYHYRVLKVIR